MKSLDLKRRITERMWGLVKGYFSEQRMLDPSLIQNLNYANDPLQKKAVVCYQTYSYFVNWESTSCGRTQPFEIMAIIHVLSELGYCIDLIDCNNQEALPQIASKKYDLIFGFGENFYQLTQRQPWAKSVLYMTEHHPAFSFREEQKRISYYNARHQASIKLTRSGTFYTLKHLEATYTNLIVMGETEPFEAQYEQVYAIFPTGLFHPGFSFEQKPHTETRKRFLWLGSPGASIHKGLDLLLDIFQDRDDLVLHIAGLSKEDRKVLHIPAKANIIDHGFVDIRSGEFLEIVADCSYLVLPSCSEGFATSVTTGMLHGLIPVVMKDTGFNRISNMAYILDDYHLDYMAEQLDILSNTQPDALAERSRQVYEFAKENFTIAAFQQSFSEIFDHILYAHDQSRSPANTSALVR